MCANRWQLLCFRDSGLETLACVMRTGIPNNRRLCGSNGSSSYTVLPRIRVSHARPRHADLRFNFPPQSCQTAVKMWTAASKRAAVMSHRLHSTRDRPLLLPPQQTKIVSVQQTGWKDISERLCSSQHCFCFCLCCWGFMLVCVTLSLCVLSLGYLVINIEPEH